MAESLEELIRDPSWAEKVRSARQQGFSYDEIESRLREKGAFAAPQTAAPSPAPQQDEAPRPGIMQAVGNAAMERVVKPVAQSAYNLSPIPMLSDIYKSFTGTPEERKALIQQRASEGTLGRMVQPGLDIATVAGPVMAPYLTAAGVATQGGLEAAGVDKGMANAGGTAVEVLGGLGNILRKGTVKGLAGQAQGDIAQLATGGTADETGALLKKTTPQKLSKAKEIVGSMFDRLRDDAKKVGTAMTPAHPEYVGTGEAIAETQRLLGPNLVGRNAKILDDIGEAVAKGDPITYQHLDDAARFLDQNVGGGDGAASRIIKHARGQLRDAQAAMVQGTPLEPRLALARARWGKEVAPYDDLVSHITDRGTTNAAAYQHAVGDANDAGRAQTVMKLVGEKTPEADKIRGGFFNVLEHKAGGDAGKFTRAWKAAAPEVKKVMAGTNAPMVDRLMTRLERVGKAQAIGKGLGGLGGKVVTGLSLVGGVGTAAIQFANGERDPQKLAIPLGVALAGGASRRLLTLAVKGASTPAGTAAGERLMTLIAAEANRLSGSRTDSPGSPVP